MTLDEILRLARQSQELERLEQIKYVVLEASGRISVIPMAPEPPPPDSQ